MADALDRGREFFGRHAWGDAFAELSAADRNGALGLEDLERLAVAAYLVGAPDAPDAPDAIDIRISPPMGNARNGDRVQIREVPNRQRDQPSSTPW